MNLLTIVSEAFSERIRPQIIVSPDKNHELDCDCADALHFEGMNWQDITCDYLNNYYGAIFSFAPNAFCYFLPGVISASIRKTALI